MRNERFGFIRPIRIQQSVTAGAEDSTRLARYDEALMLLRSDTLLSPPADSTTSDNPSNAYR
jgi:hypothetical protein